MTRSRLRSVSKVALVAVVTTLTACGGASHQAEPGVTTSTSAAKGGAVAWLDQPVRSSALPSLLPKPLPPVLPQTGAPECLSPNLSVVGYSALGIMQDDGIVVEFRNVGRTTCILKATPRVEATAPGQVTLVATTDPLPSYGEIANIAPRGTVMLQVHDSVACTAGAEEGLPTYSTVVVDIPGGGSKAITGLHLVFPCGMQNSPFWSSTPPPTYPANPLVDLVPQLRLPTAVKAGTTLVYEVELINHGDRPVPLSPCPVYLEYSSIPRSKFVYRLNCSTVHDIPAHGQVIYQMEMGIPPSALPGSTELWWTLFGVLTLAKGQFQVR